MLASHIGLHRVHLDVAVHHLQVGLELPLPLGVAHLPRGKVACALKELGGLRRGRAASVISQSHW